MVVGVGVRNRVKLSSHRLALAWLELPTDTKRVSTWAFLSVFPDMGHREKRSGRA